MRRREYRPGKRGAGRRQVDPVSKALVISTPSKYGAFKLLVVSNANLRPYSQARPDEEEPCAWSAEERSAWLVGNNSIRAVGMGRRCKPLTPGFDERAPRAPPGFIKVKVRL